MKSWRPSIEQHIQTWSNKLGNLHWWPRFVYHFTDVQNAARVIQAGYLYSRNEVLRKGLMQVDNASPSVIQHTRQEHMSYVRLYFRPRTPTQYRNEGIRPIGQRELGGAHCPIPIYFCFDALDVLCRDECEFSDGNMGSPRARHSAEEHFFTKIPFHLVYHSGAMPSDKREEITYHRNAEVLIPHRLPLDKALKVIVCRSVAEMQTLLYLLPDAHRTQWSTRMRLGDWFYERKWTFIEEVVTVDNRVIFRFNPDTRTPGPFQVKFTYKDDSEVTPNVWQGKIENLSHTLEFLITNANTGVVTLHLDDTLAYIGKIIVPDIPF